MDKKKKKKTQEIVLRRSSEEINPHFKRWVKESMGERGDSQ